ncbi:MAG: GTP-binding protein [Solobacterium sp.]|uniref:CobW family GTP-binding protein n=1 Tax=Solobacterium sp. TaxID=2060878 RepID=UPI001CB5D079|nr:CobW family GTP-binding protein [Solobacterium sp.]MBF1089670.1 GTP-binding protein [Solobacterium sp.]
MTKIDIISGFLGAGKTTLIQKLIKEVYAGKKVVLVENEFGEIGIDGGFLKDAGIVVNEINSGCICCTLQGDFRNALQEVVKKYDPDHIIIEPSGVGKLSDILAVVKDVEGLQLNSYSTVVDAKRCEIYHKNFKEFFDDQISTAACVILSRTQLVDEETLQKDIAIIRELNHDARIITTPWDDLSGQAIIDAMEGSTDGFPELEEEEECCCCGCGCHDEDDDDDCCCDHDHHEHEHHHHHEEEECCCCGSHEHEEHHHEHHHDDEECCCHHHHEEEEHDEEECCCCGHDHHDHEHHHHHHHGHDADEVFTSIGIETVNKYSVEDIALALSELDEHIIRAKGIVPSTDGSWLFFDYVPGDADIRIGSPAYTGLITVIGDQVDVDRIKEIFAVK